MLKSCLLLILPAITVVQAAPPDKAIYRNGDWNIKDAQVVDGANIVLAGNLLIASGGSLTLRNSTLLFDAPPQGMYRIQGNRGSHLLISNSTIAGVRPEVRFGFSVDGGELRIQQSVLDDIGTPPEMAPIWNGGLTVEHTSGFLFENSTLTYHESNGISVANSTGAWIHGSTITHDITAQPGTHGVLLQNSDHNVVSGNRILNVPAAVTMQASSWNVVDDNEVVLLHHTLGISIWHGSGNNIVRANRVSVLAGQTEPCTAFRAIGTPYPNYFLDNDVDGTWEGALISYSSNVVMANNRFRNLFNVQTGGIHVYRSHNIQLLNNDISDSTDGLMLIASPNNIIKGNRVTGALYGLALMKSSGNEIEGNTFAHNQDNAILFDSHDNRLIGNNFLKTSRQAYDLLANTWSGNFWDDYSGSGGATYTIEGNAADSAPATVLNPEIQATVPPMVEAPIAPLPETDASIFADTLWSNCDRQLSGMVNVNPGATLTIRNCRITPAPRQQNQIGVLPGGRLIIESSEVGGDGLDNYINIDGGDGLVIRNSRFHYLGDWGGNPGIATGAGADIENNEIVGSYNGLSMAGGGHRIVNNRFADCLWGIQQGGGAGSVIQGNTAIGCVFAGISVLGATSPNTIAGNFVDGPTNAFMVQGIGSQVRDNRAQNSQDGINIFDTGIVVADNALVHNGSVEFAWQTGASQASDTGHNAWDDRGRGNYWSDYNGVDANGDGVGDSPYVGRVMVDHFPLMAVPPAVPDACAYVLGQLRQSAPAGGAMFSTEVIAPAACGWTAIANADWITVATAAGTGRTPLAYTVAANTGGSARSGSIVVAGQTLTVTQAGQGH